MSSVAAANWWQHSVAEAGVRAMDKHLSPDATWEEVLASGHADFARALSLTGLTTGDDRTVVEIGCGIGRMTAALAEHFGRVVGLDIAPALLEEASARNKHAHVRFELADGSRVQPRSVSQADTVFSYEVFYYIAPPVVEQYFQDVHRLLRPGGEFVFQLNLEPLRWTTRLSYFVRGVLHRFGVQHWRGWPTGPGFRRHAFAQIWVTRTLAEAGFEVVRVISPQLRETWFVARKPLSTAH